MMTQERKFSALQAAPLLLAGIFFVCWYLIYVDGIWGYAQHLIIKKKVVPASIFVLTLGFLVLVRRRSGADREQSKAVPIMYAWLIWMLVVLMIASEVALSVPFRIAFGFYVNYWHFFLAALIINSAFAIKEEHFLKMFLISAIPVIGLAVAQGVMQDNFAIGRWIAEEASAFNLGFYGKRRSNSVFAHAEDLGFYSGTVICICIALMMKYKNGLLRFCLFGLMGASAASLYFTLTRATYMMGLFASIATVLIYRASKKREYEKVFWLPFAFFFVALIIYFAAPIISFLANSDTILSTASLGDRLYGNQYYISELRRGGWYTALTGMGWFINGHYRATYPIDNQYIAVLLSVGAVGLILWLGLTISIWRVLVKRAVSSGSPAIIGLAAAASTWLGQSIFNVINIFSFAAILGLVIICTPDHAEENRSI